MSPHPLEVCIMVRALPVLGPVGQWLASPERPRRALSEVAACLVALRALVACWSPAVGA